MNGRKKIAEKLSGLFANGKFKLKKGLCLILVAIYSNGICMRQQRDVGPEDHW